MRTKKNGKVQVKEEAAEYKTAPQGEEKAAPAQEEQLKPNTKADPEPQVKADKKGKGEKKGDGKKAFETKPIPKAVQPIAESINKVSDMDALKALARVLQKRFREIYNAKVKKAAGALKVGEVVSFKAKKETLSGKVLKIKSTGKVKIDVSGKIWRVPATMVQKAA